MAARANWKGYLKLSLVSCAVALFPATTINERTRFNIINRKTGNRIHNQVVDAETGDVVEKEGWVKGYPVEDDQYILHKPSNVVNLMDALRRSVGTSTNKKSASGTKAAKKTSRRRPAAKRAIKKAS